MECPHKTCANAEDCSILDIIKKIPARKESCSYSQNIKAVKKKSDTINRRVDQMAHMTHCNQGEYIGSCKYGDDKKCPALQVKK
jgi:hypothetical protein